MYKYFILNAIITTLKVESRCIKLDKTNSTEKNPVAKSLVKKVSTLPPTETDL
jgi:hypothetical protein